MKYKILLGTLIILSLNTYGYSEESWSEALENGNIEAVPQLFYKDFDTKTSYTSLFSNSSNPHGSALASAAHNMNIANLDWEIGSKGLYDCGIECLTKVAEGNVRLSNETWADLFKVRGGFFKEKKEYLKAKDDLEKSISKMRTEGNLRDASRLYSTCPDDSIRDGQRALEYAQESYDLAAPEEGRMKAYCKSILAYAYAELGQFDKAIELQYEAVEFKMAEYPDNYKEHRSYKDYKMALDSYKEGPLCQESCRLN